MPWTTRKGYVVVRHEGRDRYRSHLVWNEAHPEDPIDTTKHVIHHIDHVTDHDVPSNLEKLTRSEHMKAHGFGHNAGVHRGGPGPPPSRWTPEARKRHGDLIRAMRAKRFWSSRPKQD